jgi:hypothetical protein
VLKSIEQLSPGLYLMRIQEGDRTNGWPSYKVSFEEKELEDLRRLNKLERRDERPFDVVSAVSDLGERAYLMFVRPWLLPMRSEPMAQLARVFHPQRVQQWAWSDLIPQMWPLAPLAESVKTARRTVASDNPFLALERLGSTAISASWDLFRDLRDAVIESLFFLTYGGLMSLGIPAEAGAETVAEPPAVRKALQAIDRGGFLEAIARVGALMASQRGEFPLGRLELASDLQHSDPVLSKLTEEEARRIRSQQSIMVYLEPDKALQTLPKLLTDRRDREHLIELLERAVATVELNSDQRVMLDRIRLVLVPSQSTARGNRRARSSTTTPPSSS